MARRRRKTKDHGVVTGRINISGQRIPVRVKRPTLDITKEEGTRLRLRKEGGGTSRLIVEGRGRSPRRRPRLEFDFVEMRERLKGSIKARLEALDHGWNMAPLEGKGRHIRVSNELRNEFRPQLEQAKQAFERDAMAALGRLEQAFKDKKITRTTLDRHMREYKEAVRKAGIDYEKARGKILDAYQKQAHEAKIVPRASGVKGYRFFRLTR